MNSDPSCAYPQIFMVDRGGMQTAMGQAVPLPCWSFPPQRAKSSKRSCGEGCVMTIVLLMLFLVLAALGLGAYQIMKLQAELVQLRQEMATQSDMPTVQRQTGLEEIKTDQEIRQAAHLTIKTEKSKDYERTLHWVPKHSPTFTSGVVYRHADGGLQVNETGLYFVYSRVEYEAVNCDSQKALIHKVFKKGWHPEPSILLKGHPEDYCRKGHWSASSYVGGVQKLDRLDRLYVNVTYPALLSHEHKSSFFGLFKI
ncbi:tumor necrosis factor ligand superfamily member 6-like [Scleropages formosus]|uniref:Tumor necrosis factor ligand superfamily member 6-like n=1 Tax=Scleropages formosus TaxID=113540 RepID=A0A0P7W622_SCLFO|nr:tumor necrosis factor ligand superfamily member 6-like [Scleropages formosus]